MDDFLTGLKKEFGDNFVSDLEEELNDMSPTNIQTIYERCDADREKWKVKKNALKEEIEDLKEENKILKEDNKALKKEIEDLKQENKISKNDHVAALNVQQLKFKKILGVLGALGVVAVAVLVVSSRVRLYSWSSSSSSHLEN